MSAGSPHVGLSPDPIPSRGGAAAEPVLRGGAHPGTTVRFPIKTPDELIEHVRGLKAPVVLVAYTYTSAMLDALTRAGRLAITACDREPEHEGRSYMGDVVELMHCCAHVG